MGKTKKPCSHLRRLRSFCFYPLHEQAWLGMKTRITRFARDPQEGVALQRKSLALAEGESNGLSYFQPLQQQAVDGLKNNKTLVLRTKAFPL
jgi:hypothetical protein